jgi:hypothetical protein
MWCSRLYLVTYHTVSFPILRTLPNIFFLLPHVTLSNFTCHANRWVKYDSNLALCGQHCCCYFDGTWFESQPGDQLSWLIIRSVLKISQANTGAVSLIDYDCFLTHSFWFILHENSALRACQAYALEESLQIAQDTRFMNNLRTDQKGQKIVRGDW